MKSHYTAGELAALQLPDLPASAWGIVRRADRECWPSRPQLERSVKSRLATLQKALPAGALERLIAEALKRMGAHQ